ncbi:phosphoribosylanthranilate isomerase [Pontibacillus salipaludis]|uniref:phosphoribosylanthranilate isomerase n=1 Tax=Pontibacillus salipaludis TaxID=1697394 RepID=UPI0031EFA378
MSQTALKFCGNRSFEDLKNSIQSGVPYVGVIFAESKRQVLPEQVSDWLEREPLSENQQIVGVFVNPSMLEIEEALHLTHLDIIQLHGTETLSEVLAIKERFKKPVWKAIHHSEDALERMGLFQGVVDGYVVDSKVKGHWGGSGVRFDWGQAPFYIEEGKRQGVPCFIAGGVTDENVSELVKLKPAGIDVSSGIESDEAKDMNKMSKFVRGIHHVSRISG